jgi:hypothetical protein
VVRRVAITLFMSVVLSVAAPVCGPSPTAAAAMVAYRAPSDAPIVDRFRPPPEPWMPGNRGIDYGTSAGAEITAAADGRVVFAGSVAGSVHVSIAHDDGLRTSYSFVASAAVVATQRVRAGQVVAVAGGPFHFGVRTPDDTYLDPEAVLAGAIRPRARLVPGTDDGLPPLAAERRSLLDSIAGGGVAALAALGTAATDATGLAWHYWVESHPATHARRVADVVRAWSETECTPASTPVPVRRDRRIVVLVSGLGTHSGANTTLEIDTEALGYAPADVVPFSYAGGRAPRAEPVAHDPFVAITERAFDARDSQQSVSESADRLGVLLQQVAATEPGVPIDVIAHSQGGVVARLAVARAGDEARLPPEVESLVTVASPHRGAPLATAVGALDRTPGGRASLSRLRDRADGLDDRLPAIGDLAETSSTMSELDHRSIPERVRYVTLGASGDLVVPGTAALDPEADAVVLLPTDVGTDPHGSVASSPASIREIGLAVAGRGPTCRPLTAVMMSAVMAETIHWGETTLAATALLTTAGAPIPPAE